MATTRTRNWAAFALLVAICGPALAGRHTGAAPVAAPAAPLAATRFDLATGAIPQAAAVQASSRALAREGAGQPSDKDGAEFRNITVGPSWSYQTSRSGPLFEMGALGGDVVEDRPRLAHVAVAWQF